MPLRVTPATFTDISDRLEKTANSNSSDDSSLYKRSQSTSADTSSATAQPTPPHPRLDRTALRVHPILPRSAQTPT
ncbi:hypothetical protein VTI74DRAFT_8392 [Chaetomium olivicolor]